MYTTETRTTTGAVTLTLNNSGGQQDNQCVIEVAGTFTSVVAAIRGSVDGTNFSNILARRMDTGAVELTPTLTDSTVRKWVVDCTNLQKVQLNISSGTLTSGMTVSLASTYVPYNPNPSNLTSVVSQTVSGPLTLTNLNLTVGASTAAAGSTVADAGALPAGTGGIYPTTAADGTKGVVLNAADQVTGRTVIIGNGVSNQILKVYAPSGGSINGAAANAAFSSVSGKGVLITCLSGAGNTWLAE